MFTYSIKRACEIRKFYVAVVQRRQRNVQNSVMHVQRRCFVNKNRLLFCRSPCRRRRPRRRGFCFHPEIVLPWQLTTHVFSLLPSMYRIYIFMITSLYKFSSIVFLHQFVYFYHFKCCNSLFYSHLAFLAPDES